MSVRWIGRSPPAPRIRTCGRRSPTASSRRGWWSTCRRASTSAPTGCEKRDLVVAAAAAITLPRRAAAGTGSARSSPPATDTCAFRPAAAASTRRRCCGASRPPRTPPDGVRGDLRGAIESLRRPQRRRGLAVVISDFLGPIDWERLAARPVAARHDVLGVEVLDPRDLELPDVGDVVLHDPESGRTREFTTHAAIARRLRAQRRSASRRRRDGAAHVRRTATDACAPTVTGSPTSCGSSRAVGTAVRRSPRPGWRAVSLSQISRHRGGCCSCVVVAALAVGYVIVQRRRQTHVMRFTNMELLEKVAPTRPGIDSAHPDRADPRRAAAS